MPKRPQRQVRGTGAAPKFAYVLESWLGTVENKDKPISEALRDFCREHPEYAPSLEIRATLRTPNRAILEARRGDPTLLLARLRLTISGYPLTQAEVNYIENIVRAAHVLDQRGRDALREEEQTLIAEQVEAYMREDGTSQERAIKKVMEERRCSRTHVFKALRAYRERQSQVVGPPPMNQ